MVGVIGRSKDIEAFGVYVDGRRLWGLLVSLFCCEGVSAVAVLCGVGQLVVSVAREVAGHGWTVLP